MDKGLIELKRRAESKGMMNFPRTREALPLPDGSACRPDIVAPQPRRSALGVILMVLLGAAKIHAQSNLGELWLKVTDPSGQGVKSSVELASDVNQFSNTYTTDSGGNLDAKLLPF